MTAVQDALGGATDAVRVWVRPSQASCAGHRGADVRSNPTATQQANAPHSPAPLHSPNRDPIMETQPMTSNTLPHLEPQQAPANEPAITNGELQHSPLEELDPRHFDPTQGRQIGSRPYDDPPRGARSARAPTTTPPRGARSARTPTTTPPRGARSARTPTTTPPRGARSARTLRRPDPRASDRLPPLRRPKRARLGPRRVGPAVPDATARDRLRPAVERPPRGDRASARR
jgi:hypothetical protein